MRRLKSKSLIPAVTAALLLFAFGIVLLLPNRLESASRKRNSSPAPQNVTTSEIIATPIASPSPLPAPTASLSDQTGGTQSSGFCLNVPILLYHHLEPLDLAKKEGHATLTVDPSYFDQQMSYLVSHGYKTISAETLAQALINHQKLPARSIVITIDDGYQDVYTYAYPIIQKYHLTASLMIATGLLNNWGYLTWDQLKQMASSGLVFAYDHTWSHASLPKDSRERAQFEILTAKKQLEENLGKTVNVFAYPYGSENQSIIDLLKSDGFIAALSTSPGFFQCESNIMSLRRSRIGNNPLSSYGL